MLIDDIYNNKGLTMSKKKKLGVLTVSDTANGQVVPESELHWEDLRAAYSEAAQSVIGQMQLLVALMRRFEVLLTEKPDIMQIARGLMLSYQDIALEIKNTGLHHAEEIGGILTNFKTGEVSSENDDYFDYIRIGGEYIVQLEKIAHLSSTTYLDLITKTSADVDVLAAADALRDELDINTQNQTEV